MVSRDEQKEAMMLEFINEYQRKHYEACVRAQEDSKKHPMKAGEARERAQRIRDLAKGASK